MITTRGWGSGAVTSAGWGATAAAPAPEELVISPPFFGLAGDLLHIVVRVRHLIRCKVDPAQLQAQIDAIHVTLEGIESDYAALLSRMRAVENTHPLVFDLDDRIRRKITEAEFDTRRAIVDVDIEQVDSDFRGLLQRMRRLELDLRVKHKERRDS